MTFGDAIEALFYTPTAVARRPGWNGMGMVITYMPPMYIEPKDISGRTLERLKVIDRANHKMVGVPFAVKPNAPLRIDGYFVLFTAQGTWQPGWNASQADMTADDWEVFEPNWNDPAWRNKT